MPLTDINLGTAANNGTGTNARDAGAIINANFTYLNALIANAENTIENTYADITALLADQVNQTEGKFEYVVDASADPEITSGFALYEYLGTIVGDLTDYRLLTPGEAGVVISSSGINIFTVSALATTLANNTTTGTVKIQYENVGNKITTILFDIPYTNYLEGFEAVSGTRNLELKLFNRTQNKTLIANITGFTYSTGANKYYKVTIENTIPYTYVALNNILEAEISVSPSVAATVIDGGTP